VISVIDDWPLARALLFEARGLPHPVAARNGPLFRRLCRFHVNLCRISALGWLGKRRLNE
jgi:hypothetical protein